MTPLGVARRISDFAKNIPRHARRARATSFFRGCTKLNLGCGGNVRFGWTNVDRMTPGAVDWDLTLPLPVRPKSVDFIYSEHFVEHLSHEQGLAHFKDCFRVLRPTGILRISTPNLRYLVQLYSEQRIDEWKDDLARFEPHSPAQMLNGHLRLWGHQFVYDEPELVAALKKAGFRHIENIPRGESRHPELRNLETRPYHFDLIVEAP
jgi:predicted SAM-dependent methyltransferase